jgi:GxxExxY protein
MNRDERERLSSKIIGACIEVHRELCPGLLEAVYEYCLMEELSRLGIHADNQVSSPVIYEGKQLDKDFKVDVLVDRRLSSN